MWWRIRGWWLVVAAAVIGAVVSTAVKALPGAVASIALAVAGAVAAVLSSRGAAALADHAQQSQQAGRDLLVDVRGRLPRVRHIGDPVTVGVHPAAAMPSQAASSSRTPAFVRRDRSAELDTAVRRGGFIVVVGDSTAGKSRAAFEAAHTCLADHVFIRPADRRSVPAALAASQRVRRCVVWLDDLEQYLGSPGLTPQLLARLLGDGKRHVVVLATMRAHEHARYSPRHRPGTDAGLAEVLRAGREVLEAAVEIRLDRRWTSAELARARAFGADERIAAALRHADQFGIAEYLAAGPQLLADWQDGWSPGAHPRGAALVAAAVDARRASYHCPLPLDLLHDLHEHYLHQRGGAALRPEPWDDALAWAVEPLHATTSLLIPQDDDRYLAFDYLPDACDANSAAAPIPQPTWDKLIGIADPAEANEIGASAYAQGRWAQAKAAFGKAVANGYHFGAIGLGNCLARVLDDKPAAVTMLRTTIASAENRDDTDPADLLALRRSLAFWASQAGNAAEALQLARDATAASTRLFGAEHPDTLESRIVLASCTGADGDAAQAAAIAQHAAANCARILGEDDWRTLMARHETAFWTGQSGDLDDAIQQYQAVIADTTRVLGPGNDFTLDARTTIAHFIGENGDPAQAAELFESLVADRSRIQGADHPATLEDYDSLRHWRQAAAG